MGHRQLLVVDGKLSLMPTSTACVNKAITHRTYVRPESGEDTRPSWAASGRGAARSHR